MKNIKLGLLELGYRDQANSMQAIQHILDYAVKADALGYSRFWLAEHHAPNPLLGFTNPETLIALIAGMTEQIRVGSAGTLLHMYQPYNTVTTFKLMDNLFNQRIDLGLAKGTPDTNYTRDMLAKGSKVPVDEKIAEIYHLLYNEEANFENHEAIIPPYGGSIPQLWCLSNSYKKFEQAITYQCNYCRSIMHGGGLVGQAYNKAELEDCKGLFEEKHGYSPQVALSLGIILGDTMEAAQSSHKARFQDIHANPAGTLSIIPVNLSALCELLHEYQELYGIDEFILYDIEGEPHQKLENLEAISETMAATLTT